MSNRKLPDWTKYQCIGKVAFEDPSIARRAAKRRDGRLAYHCRHCGKWHVGSRGKIRDS